MYQDAGWYDIWCVYRNARGTAAANGHDLPRCPVFLAANKELVPREYQLGRAEAGVAAFPRQLSGTEAE